MIDITVDRNLTEFHALAGVVSFPDMVKSASTDREALSTLPNASFADPVSRRFPCHSAAHTVLSYAYFTKQAKDIPSHRSEAILVRLQKFACQWGVAAECAQVTDQLQKAASPLIDQLPDEQFAIVGLHNGTRYRALPLINAQCVKAAVAHLEAYRDRYPCDWRMQAAKRIVKRAAELDEPITSEYIKRAGGAFSGSGVDFVAEQLFARAKAVPRSHYGSREHVAMAKVARTFATADSPILDVNLIDRFDRRFGLNRLYGKGLVSPEELAHCGVEITKIAEARATIISTTSGRNYTKQALASAGLKPFRVLGDDFVDAISNGLSVNIDKLASVMPTLPRPDAEILDRALLAAGIPDLDAQLKSAGIKYQPGVGGTPEHAVRMLTAR